ncbi:MAG: hypothetical protein NW208_15475 [Bryobacter sp.]|nr:hypothetical protein [Bryobacter sp.]
MSRATISAAIEAARRRGCKKFFFVYVGHGNPLSAGDGLVLRSDQVPGSTETVSYEDLAQEFKKLGDVELCIIVEACFSGQIIPFLQGIGLKGSVFASSSRDRVTRVGIAGTDIVPGLRAVGNDFTKLGEWIEKNGTADGKRGEPESSTISATGTRAIRLPYLRFSAPGESYRGFVPRPKSSPATSALEINNTLANRDIATFSSKLTFAANSNTAGAESTALREGLTAINGTGTEKPGDIAYAGIGGIQVGELLITPANCFQPIGSTCEYEVIRLGATEDAAPALEFEVTSSKPDIAPVTTPLVFNTGQLRKTFRTANPRKEGVSEITLKAKQNPQLTKTVFADFYPITFSGSSAGVETEGEFSIFLTFLRLTANHICCILLRNQLVRFQFMDMGMGWSDIRIFGDGNTIPREARGTLNQTTGEFTASGSQRVSTFDTTTTIEGRFSTAAAIEEEVSSQSFRAGPRPRGLLINGVTFTARVGSSGNLPGGQPEIFEGSGTYTAPCTYTLNPTSITLTRNSSRHFVNLITGESCTWTATRTGDYLSLEGSLSGRGPARIYFSVAQNDTLTSRNASISAGGQTLALVQPGVTAQTPTLTGVVNAASFQGGIASGSWVTLSGTNLAAETRVWANADFSGNALPTRLGDTSVTIGGKPAYIFFISPNQVNVLAPDGLAPGQQEVILRRGTVESNRFLTAAKAIGPGLFLFDAASRRYVAAVNPDGVLAAPAGLYAGLTTRPPRSGEIVLLYLTGMGETQPATPANVLVAAPAETREGVAVRIGGVDALLLYAGKISSGLYQLNLRLPNLPPGEHEVEVFVNGFRAQEGAYLAIQ